jgi:hypothetical protein
VAPLAPAASLAMPVKANWPRRPGREKSCSACVVQEAKMLARDHKNTLSIFL